MNVDLLALIIPVIVLALLLFGMRWTSQRSDRPLTQSGDPADLHMLEVIASGVPRADAMEMRGKLGEAHIQTSMTQSADDAVDVLVRQDDVDAARELLKRW